MFADRFFGRLFHFCAIVFALGFSVVYAQEESISEIRYKDDYDQLQRIIKITDPAKRGDQMLIFYKGRTDIDPKIRAYGDNIFIKDLESLMNKGNYAALSNLSERAVRLRPRFGEAYLFYGVALKAGKKISEAMNAFAKCYLIENQFKQKAKQLLDTTYRSANRGSLIGEDKLIKNAANELK